MVDVQRDPEARLIYLLCIVLTAPFIVTAFASGSDIGAGTTICMLIAAAGLMGLVTDWRNRVRLPRACVMSTRVRPRAHPSRVVSRNR